ncbi:unnamed protein product [Cuscuta europaea]|uniref:Cytochrome P450 n=1 Tax=Cuscuta europaea TaxID=41803 RepID=A0A9P0Z636_CUSEU|nr:unnamed protein product [Cuscuta europaea]
MEIPLPLLILLPAAFATTFVLLAFMQGVSRRSKYMGRKVPQAGFAWPIIGHFHLFAANKRPTHKILSDMADKYGPVFRLRLGAREVVVVSDSQTAKECFTVNDAALAGRPKSISTEHLGSNYASFALAPPGQLWREVRKVVVLELLSSRRLDALRRVRQSALRTFSQDIHRSWLAADDRKDQSGGAAVMLEMKEWCWKLVAAIMFQALFGQLHEEEWSRAAETVERFFNLMGASVVGDYLPWLRWIDIGGYEKAMKKSAKEMDDLMEGLLQEHKKGKSEKPKEEGDFMDALISHFDCSKEVANGFDADTVIKSTCTTLLAAGTDTTANSLTWALSLILNKEDVLEKIRGELDKHVGRERLVIDSDINNLTYLQAVVKETLRLYPPGPLLIPHEALQDCTINSYRIFKGTRLLINVSKIHRDSSFWMDPDIFKPERFLTKQLKEIDVRGKHFELLPFGSGRRICPGISFGIESVQLGLANIIQGFDVRRPSSDLIDMSEAIGLGSTKEIPLQVFITPRLPFHLYL